MQIELYFLIAQFLKNSPFKESAKVCLTKIYFTKFELILKQFLVSPLVIN